MKVVHPYSWESAAQSLQSETQIFAIPKDSLKIPGVSCCCYTTEATNLQTGHSLPYLPHQSTVLQPMFKSKCILGLRSKSLLFQLKHVDIYAATGNVTRHEWNQDGSRVSQCQGTLKLGIQPWLNQVTRKRLDKLY